MTFEFNSCSCNNLSTNSAKVTPVCGVNVALPNDKFKFLDFV